MVAMTGVRLEFKGSKELLRKLEGSSRALAREWRRTARDLGIEWERRIKSRQFGPFRASSYPDKLRNRTGSTRRGIRFRLAGSGVDTVLRLIGSGPHLALQEFGGTVHAKDKLLKVPLPTALTGSGTIRSDARFDPSTFRNARGERSFVFKSKRGNLIVAVSRRGQLIPYYVLKDQVTIPPGRLGFRRTWEEMRDFRREALAAMLFRANLVTPRGRRSR